ncbi:MAG: endonuclease domain-containing protein [Candidatus Limnocylindria bacterium]
MVRARRTMCDCGRPVPQGRRLFCSYRCSMKVPRRLPDLAPPDVLQLGVKPRRGTCDCGRPVPQGRRLFCSYLCSMKVPRGLPYRAPPHVLHGLWLEQAGVCPLCERSFDGAAMRPVVDHDHATGVVRGLLCQNCNLRLGHFERFRASDLAREARYGAFGIRASAYLAAAGRRDPDRQIRETEPHAYGVQIAV